MDTKFNISEWNRIKLRLKSNYPVLTNADLVWGHTSRNDLLNLISAKLGKTQKELVDEIDALEYSNEVQILSINT